MTTQVTIKNHGPHKITIKSLQCNSDNNKMVTMETTLAADEEQSFYIWQDIDYYIEEEEDEEAR